MHIHTNSSFTSGYKKLVRRSLPWNTQYEHQDDPEDVPEGDVDVPDEDVDLDAINAIAQV